MAAQPVKLPRGVLGYLKRRDPSLAKVMRKIGPFNMSFGSAESELEALTRSIVYQQLSGKAAGTIYARFRALFAAQTPTIKELETLGEEALRGVGLSRQKISYLKDLAAKAEPFKLSQLHTLDDDAAIRCLTQIKGFGRWSAEMFLIFHLGRLNVWPVDDLGVRKAISIIHEHEELPQKILMQETGELYQPYRTVATWYLWRSLDNQ
jgi:3-methyladenine DNA glycosylase/8-oxoguanine DNA glycosylase